MRWPDKCLPSVPKPAVARGLVHGCFNPEHELELLWLGEEARRWHVGFAPCASPPLHRLPQFNATVGGWFGVISYDWSNAKAQWAAAKPMDDEELLVAQAAMTKAVSPDARVFVYRNLVKALPWYTSVREKVSDPAYAGWFLPFKPGGSFPNGSWHVPACDSNYDPPLCSALYHGEGEGDNVRRCPTKLLLY